jgi:hypothetical protein
MKTSESFIIDSRFNGPPESGNGGYSCGMLGKLIDGPAVVRLRIPPPLDTPMQVRKTADGVALFHKHEMVASARSAVVDIDIPVPPDFAGAEAASLRYRGFDAHFYPRCFVCGPEREHGDGLRVFAGSIEDNLGPKGMVAGTWVADDSLLNGYGKVASEYIWSVLDCPGAYAFSEPETGTILLGELAVSIKASVSAAEKCVVTGWEISHQGRKHHTGTALFGESGECYAVACATWFEVLINS